MRRSGTVCSRYGRLWGCGTVPARCSSQAERATSVQEAALQRSSLRGWCGRWRQPLPNKTPGKNVLSVLTWPGSSGLKLQLSSKTPGPELSPFLGTTVKRSELLQRRPNAGGVQFLSKVRYGVGWRWARREGDWPLHVHERRNLPYRALG